MCCCRTRDGLLDPFVDAYRPGDVCGRPSLPSPVNFQLCVRLPPCCCDHTCSPPRLRSLPRCDSSPVHHDHTSGLHSDFPVWPALARRSFHLRRSDGVPVTAGS
ncbi:uncharacterized protein SCHCODRAFT_02332648 [Schizophyllum commune H4-8]|uniref:uncharacterized protein n=1 Tax=Schizophyllum commune (strain H4-8 / FGSC 9210) TaxID=578458 RepID=UPI00215FCC67|nr:uncharacterized protein SCHCODRAFT_02332648 [Schizophyllum commune H4-8]KAI5889924.1 hypothetical protein SCHCODRAFT_02332648 [Schizophyllum commune H4-8]